MDTVEIAGIDQENPQVRKWVDRFAGHAVSPEHVADKILKGVSKNRYLIYTSNEDGRNRQPGDPIPALRSVSWKSAVLRVLT